MQTRTLSLLPLVVLCAISHVWAQYEVKLGIPDGFSRPGQTFVVKNSGDSGDATPGDAICADVDGNCTLRAAIDEANANNAAGDVILFGMAYPAVIELSSGSLSR